MHVAKFPLLSTRQLGLLAVQSLPGAGIWYEPCRPVEFRHDQRVPFTHGGEGQNYRMAGPNLLAAIVIHWHPSISVKPSGIGNPPGRQSSQSSWPIYCSPANTGGQSANSSLSVRFCPYLNRPVAGR